MDGKGRTAHLLPGFPVENSCMPVNESKTGGADMAFEAKP